MSEIGAVYQVEVTRAGGWLVGDHSEDATELSVSAAWDFDEAGGTLTIDDVAYEYTSVSFPVDSDTGEPVDDEPATIVLATGLESDLLDGDLVLAFPYSETKTALVEAKGFGEAVEVRVPHDLYDRLPETISGTAAEAYTVTIVPDGDGWVIEDVPGRAPNMDGGFIDPDTMPPAAPVEPVAPASSPTPTLTASGIGSLRIAWTPVANATTVTYDVHFGSSSPNVGDYASLVESTAASSTVVSVDPFTGDALVADTNYYAAIVARSEDQYAPGSSVSSPAQIEVVDLSGLDELQDDIDELNDVTLPALQDELDDILPITETKIADGAISTPKLQAGSVVADKIGAGEVVAGKIAADAVTANELAADSVTAEQLTAGSVDADAIAANAVHAEHVSANSIDGEKLTGTVILGSDIATAEEGERHGLSAEDGHYSYDSAGGLVFRARGGDVQVTGGVTATSLDVVGGATWSGDNAGAPGASTMMADRINPPAVPPVVEPFYDTITLDGGDIAGDDESKRRGLVWHDTHWWVASGAVGSNVGMLLKFTPTGTFVSSDNTGEDTTAGSLTLLGSTFYLKSATTSRVHRFDSSGEYESSFNLSGVEPILSAGVLGTDGSHLVLAWNDDQLRWWRYNTSGSAFGSQVNTGVNVSPHAVIQADPGSVGTVAVGGPQFTTPFTLTGDALYDERFRTHNTIGLVYVDWPGYAGIPSGSRYFRLSSSQTISAHTDALTSEDDHTVPLWVGASWARSVSSGGPNSTALGATSAQAFWKRAFHRLSMTSDVPMVGGATGANFYVGRSDARLRMQGNGSHHPGAGERPEFEISSLILPEGTSDASEPPPASGNFPASTPYDHFSQAVIPGTSDPQTSLKGDGESVLYGLKIPFAYYYRASSLNIPHASVTQVAIGTVGEAHDCVTANGGGSWTINWPGLYRIEVHFTFETGSGYRTGSILKNGNDVVDDIQYAGGSYTSVHPSKTLRLAAGDVITDTLYQNSNNPLTIFSGEDRAFITFERLGA